MTKDQYYLAGGFLLLLLLGKRKSSAGPALPSQTTPTPFPSGRGSSRNGNRGGGGGGNGSGEGPSSSDEEDRQGRGGKGLSKKEKAARNAALAKLQEVLDRPDSTQNAAREAVAVYQQMGGQNQAFMKELRDFGSLDTVFVLSHGTVQANIRETTDKVTELNEDILVRQQAIAAAIAIQAKIDSETDAFGRDALRDERAYLTRDELADLQAEQAEDMAERDRLTVALGELVKTHKLYVAAERMLAELKNMK